MKTIIAFLLGLVLMSSCEDESKGHSEDGSTIADNEFTIVVESTADLGCALPVILFIDKADEVKMRTKLEALKYNAYHLDNSLNVTGKTLIIEFAEVKDEDLRACNAFGVAIPGISIIKARPAN